MTSTMRKKPRRGDKTTFKLLVTLAAACHAHIAMGSDQVGMQITSEAKDLLERHIDGVATQVANHRPYLEDDPLPIHIKSVFDVGSNRLIMDMDERLGPTSGDGSLEDLQLDIREAIQPLIKDIPGLRGIEWRFGGKEMYHWFPDDRPEKRAREQGRRDGPAVLIGAGHGYYYHHGYKDWRPQREIHNDILEDEITTQYAAMLYGQLLTHGVSPGWIREARFAGHEPSGQPYQMVAARYQLADRLPERPDIWHSLPESTSNQRERLEDIRSRPLYANEMGAGALVHIHTNASENSLARGTKVFHYESSVESAELGAMILCYMRESIHSLDRYKDFPVDSFSTAGDHGENRLASMPSVIVEVGFHTNADDAAALKDVIFMGHSMAGLAKGYRLFAAREKCQPLTLSAPARLEGFVDEEIAIPVSTEGFPDFPLSVKASQKNCTGGCEVGYELARNLEELERINVPYRCTDAGVIPIELLGRDFSGVEAELVDVSLTCHPKPEA